MIKQEFEKIIAALEAIDMNNYPVRDPLVEQETALFTKDIYESIRFIKNDCTGRQFIWLSEIFDDITQKTKSREFVACLEKAAKKFPAECEDYNILPIIEDCRRMLEE